MTICLLFFGRSVCYGQAEKKPVFYNQATVLAGSLGDFQVYAIDIMDISPIHARRFGLVLAYSSADGEIVHAFPIWANEISGILTGLEDMKKAKDSAKAKSYDESYTLASAEGCRFISRKPANSTDYQFAVRLATQEMPVTFGQFTDVRNLIAQAESKLKQMAAEQ